jgi:hypothetical protein
MHEMKTCPFSIALIITVVRHPEARYMPFVSLLSCLSTCLPDLCLGGERIWELLHVLLQGTTVAEELNVGTIHPDVSGSLLLQVLVAAERGESPVLGDDDLLPTGELVLRSSESLEGEGTAWRARLVAASNGFRPVL